MFQLKIKQSIKLKGNRSASSANLGLRKKGMVTLPFLLVSAIILFFVMVFFGLAFTLAHVSIVQYMTYSAARAYSLGGEDIPKQEKAGEDHYKKLRGGGPPPKFFKNANAYSSPNDGWLFIKREPTNVGKYNQFHSPLPPNMFYGVTTEFETRIAKFCIPFLSPPDCNQNENIDSIKIHSFLGREPSQKECGDFNDKRRIAIKQRFPMIQENDISNQADNGC